MTCPRCTTQRERIEELEEEVRQLRAQLLPQVDFPVEWRLSRSGGRMLAAMYTAAGGFVSHERMVDVIGSAQADSAAAIVGVQMCHLRKALKGTGVEIATRWGRGYELTAKSKSFLKTIVEQRMAA